MANRGLNYVSIFCVNIRLQVAGAVLVSKANQQKQELKLPYIKDDGDSSISVRRVSSMFTRLALPNLGLELLWGSCSSIYLSVTESLMGKVRSCLNFLLGAASNVGL